MTLDRDAMTALRQGLSQPPVAIEPLDDRHVQALRQACAADPDIWAIYPVCLAGAQFNPTLAMIQAQPHWAVFAILCHDRLCGMTSFLRPTEGNHLDIGATYIEPAARGTGCNTIVKQLMIGCAFALGYRAVDPRRRKAGRCARAVHRQDMTTWTGYCRDTAVYRITGATWRKAGSAHD